MIKRASSMVLITALLCASALADTVTLPIDQEARAQDLFREVRCPVCVAQPIAESDAQLSGQMRDRIRNDIVQGLSNEEILAALSATYGDSIRLKPKFELRTAPLWAAPWFAVLAGLFIIISMRRRARKTAQPDNNDAS